MFYIFIRACRKYGFTYSLNSCGELKLSLFPNGTFYNIEIKQGYYNRSYFKLFLYAIKRMKEHRKEFAYR